jgi:hypothetical protein
MDGKGRRGVLVRFSLISVFLIHSYDPSQFSRDSAAAADESRWIIH